MKTKKLEYFVDLYPNWQDFQHQPCLTSDVCGVPPPGGKRVRVVIELPCIGGKSAVTDTIVALSEEVRAGFQEAHRIDSGSL